MPAAAAAAEGEMRWGLHMTLAPKWLEEPGAGLIPGFAYSAPFEDLRLRK
jgi:hypothetical protein